MALPRALRWIFFTLQILSFSSAQNYTGPQDPRLVEQLKLDIVTFGISTTPQNRTFLVISSADGNKGPKVVEYNRQTNTSTAYPDSSWTPYKDGDDPRTHFVNPNAQRIGPDGYLYVVDGGSPGPGTISVQPYGPKLVQINITTNVVTRVYFLGNSTASMSFVDDVRFSGSDFAYLTDAGTPTGLLVLNLKSGDVRRVLDDDASIRRYIPVSAEGHLLYWGPNRPAYIYADQIEISPDGQYCYYQPNAGGLVRIPTSKLNEAFYNSSLATNNADLGSYALPFAPTPMTGDSAIDGNGVLYVSDTNSQRIVAVHPNGTMITLVQDPRLTWVDAMWVDTYGLLWMPAAQLNRGQSYNNGTSYIQKPMTVFTLNIGVGPSKVDHA